MRISPISIVQPKTNLKQTKRDNAFLSTSQALAFKGWKAGTGALLGAGAGAILGTVLSGGLLAPLILAEVGTLGGAIYGSSKEDNNSGDYDDDPDPDWHRMDT